jgi:hypothetical protein
MTHFAPLVQAPHAAPPVPHEAFDSEAYGSHAPFAVQQPFGHDVPLQVHCPLLHTWPAAHAVQAAPAVPHEWLAWEANASHVPAAVQHPLGHEIASHTHWPVVLLHSWPVGHATHAAPPVPHDMLDSEPYASHVLPGVQQPLAHCAPPQVHAPEAHDSPEAHAAQAAPPAPHEADDCEPKATHALPLQQPFGQE